ncbi:MAG TPA: diguanylate cyclase, partial [Geminicoccaceae bacterium]|nr:diguanylate cyclase [Geminicoccaceae bacterium]
MTSQLLQTEPRTAGGIGRQVILPIAALVAGAMGVVGGFVLYAAAEQDAFAAESSVRLGWNALGAAERRLARLAKDYAWWDDAVAHLHDAPDPAWADDNIGRWVYDEHGIEMSFVLAPGGYTVYASVHGERREIEAAALLSAAALGRLAERARAAPPAHPEPAVGLVGAGEGGVAVVAVAAITPEQGGALGPRSEAGSLLVFVEALDRAHLDAVAADTLLRGLRHVGPGAPTAAVAAAGGATLPLVGADGADLGALAWEPERPGRDLLRVLLAPLAAAVVAVAAATVFVLRRAHRRSTAILEAGARALAAGEARFRDFAEVSSDWFWEMDENLRFSLVSERLEAVTGLRPDSVVGRTRWEFAGVDPDAATWRRHREDLEARRPVRGFRYARALPDGRTIHFSVSGKPVFDERGAFRGYRGTGTDVTAEVEAQARLRQLSLYDALTGLPNRVLLAERIEHALAGLRRHGGLVAVLCLDIDRFKQVNDTLGHAAGDLLLKAAAERLLACVRETDTVARLGGDEFAVVQAGLAAPADAEALCRRVLACFEAPFALDGHEAFVGTSIGVALAPADGAGPAALLKHADIALYRAKEERRGGAFRFFEAGMDARLQARKVLEGDLRLALVRGGLELHYQPRVAVGTGRVVAVEALARWRHPERGLVPPGEFIPLAEETGLILALGEWVLRTACARAAGWPGGIAVSVNLAPAQVKHPELVGVVRRALADAGLEPGRLEVEITEGLMLRDAEAALPTLTALRALGVRIAMDDFGSGYSSLSY